MHKTLTLAAVVLAAGSLAACKPFWQKEPPPAPTATVVEPTTTAETPVTPADVSKPVEQTASPEAAKTSPAAKTETPTPAAK